MSKLFNKYAKAKQKVREAVAPVLDNMAKKLGDNHPLPLTLDAAVPLWAMQLQGRSWDYIQQRAKNAVDVLMETGEAILYRTKKGESARAFNALAEGIACLSFCPGGVTAFGRHWEHDLDGQHLQKVQAPKDTHPEEGGQTQASTKA